MTPLPSNDSRIREAADDDLILELTSKQAQSHFKLCDRSIAEARYLAETTWPRERLRAVKERIHASRWSRRVLSHEFYHPGVHRRLLVDGDSCARVGALYGISAQMVHIFGSELRKLASLTSRDLMTTLEEVEKSARLPGAKDEVNPQRGHYITAASRVAAAAKARAVVKARRR